MTWYRTWTFATAPWALVTFLKSAITQGFIRRGGGLALGCRVSGLQPGEKSHRLRFMAK
jgi:hypothetical protein